MSDKPKSTYARVKVVLPTPLSVFDPSIKGVDPITRDGTEVLRSLLAQVLATAKIEQVTLHSAD